MIPLGRVAPYHVTHPFAVRKTRICLTALGCAPTIKAEISSKSRVCAFSCPKPAVGYGTSLLLVPLRHGTEPPSAGTGGGRRPKRSAPCLEYSPSRWVTESVCCRAKAAFLREVANAYLVCRGFDGRDRLHSGCKYTAKCRRDHLSLVRQLWRPDEWGAQNCGFTSRQQCELTRAGNGGFCVQNPFYQPYPPPQTYAPPIRR